MCSDWNAARFRCLGCAKAKKQADLAATEVLERCQEIARVFATVEEMLRQKNLGTFGHMITRAYQLLKDDPALLRRRAQAHPLSAGG